MAITLLGTHATATGNIGSALSTTHTLNAGSNRIAYVVLGCNTTSTGHTCTYGGVSMSIVASVVGSLEAVYVFRLLEASLPSNGSQTVTVDLSGGSLVAFDIFTIQDAKQAAIEASGTNTSASATLLQKAITTLTDGAWVFTGASSSSNTTFTHDTGQTEISDFHASWGTLTTSYEEIPTAGSVTQGDTSVATSRRTMVVWADAPAPAVSSNFLWFF